MPGVTSTTGTSQVGAGSSSDASTRYAVTGMSPVGAGSSSAASTIVPTILIGWSADVSQRSLLDIVSGGGDLDYTPPQIVGEGPELLPPVGALALAPVGMVERAFTRHSVSVPAMAPGANHEVHISDAAYAGYGTVEGPVGGVGVPHIIIDGQDCTYLRGSQTGIGVDHRESPFGDVSLTIDLPQITPQDVPGSGGLSWLHPEARVELNLVHGATMDRLWCGHLVSDNGGNDATAPRTAWTASGTLWQASTSIHKVPTLMPPADIGTIIARSLNRVLGRIYPVLPLAHTGIMTTERGSSSDSELSYVQSLLAKAWTSSTQWTVGKVHGSSRTYTLRTKDLTSTDWTVTTGARGIDVQLSRDMTSTANVIYGRGIAPNGYSWAGWCHPNLAADTAPPYPFASPSTPITVGTTDADTDSGTGVSDWQRRANDLNLTPNVVVDGIFNASDSAICRVIQRDFGLSVDGVIAGQTWTATFDVGANGGDLNGAYRRPLAIAIEAEPYLYSASGAVTGDNPLYGADNNGAFFRWERDTDYGAGVTKAEAVESAQLELARDQHPGLTGTIVLHTDPREGSMWMVDPGQNIRLLGYEGANPLLHIVSVDRDWSNLTVTLSVDEHARDAMTLASIRARNKEAMIDPARRPGRTNRRSRMDQDQVVPFDGESDGGIIPKHALYSGLWTVIRIPVSTTGVVAKFDVRTSSPASKFCVAFFAGPVEPAHLLTLVGNPLTGINPFARTEAKADALDDLGLIEAFGGPGSAGGYWPGQEGSSPLTGRIKDTGGFSYNSVAGGWLWVAEWSLSSCFIRGRVSPGVVQ